MLLVLDSNEFIFALGANPKPPCQELLRRLVSNPERDLLRICRTTVADVQDHLSEEAFREFLRTLRSLETFVDEDELVPFQFGGKYLARGLKPGDAFLAGYADWVRAEVLVSENRKDFIEHPELFSFPVRTAERFLKEFR